MLLSTTQELHLGKVRTANDRWRLAKTEALSRAKVLVAEEIERYRDAMDAEVRLAFSAGVPKTQIGKEGLRTSAPQNVYDSLRRTEGAHVALQEALLAIGAEVAATVPQGAQFERTSDGTIRITLTPEELTESIRAVTYEGPLDFPGLNVAVLAADALAVVTESFIMELGERHPAAWFAGRHLAEALAWVQEHSEDTKEN